jgi:predicted nucleotidyltransferase
MLNPRFIEQRIWRPLGDHGQSCWTAEITSVPSSTFLAIAEGTGSDGSASAKLGHDDGTGKHSYARRPFREGAMSDHQLAEVVAEQPYPLVFATVGGAHLYGFASPYSDFDLSGVHLLPAREVVGLRTGPETIEASLVRGERQIDLVTHDARKFFGLMLKRNGYVLEQLTSPLVVRTSPAHAELLALVPGCLTRRHSHLYLGFAANQWQLFVGEEPRRLKPLLYVYRVLLTGIHLMRTGEFEANLARMNESFRLT